MRPRFELVTMMNQSASFSGTNHNQALALPPGMWLPRPPDTISKIHPVKADVGEGKLRNLVIDVPIVQY